MRIAATALLSVAFLGAAINDGWCPEPADLTAPLGSSTGATGAAVGDLRVKNPMGYTPNDPRNLDRAQRIKMLPAERAAGRVTNNQQAKNFLQTGDANMSYTPPDKKPLTKPPSMSDAQWERIKATRPKQQDSIKAAPPPYPNADPGDMLKRKARMLGGTLTTHPVPPKPAAAPASATASATTSVPPRTNSITPEERQRLLESRITATAAAKARLTTPPPTTSAMDRLGGGPSSAVLGGGNKANPRSGVTALKDANRPAQPAVQPRPPSGPDRNINYGASARDTFRQPR